ncbi:MAG: beta-L-arabinofuranosidase domain-containing protein [Eubacteriales bacterium]
MDEKRQMLKMALQPPSLKDISPEGWLKKQLIVQKNGLTGHIEEVWSDLGSNSGWLGGSGESWERGPYYLDGLIPLAYLLQDDYLKTKAQKWIDWIINSQDKEGFFGPASNNDWWPRIVALKALVQYHNATNDERVIPFLKKYFMYHLLHIKNRPFEMWGTARGFEELLPIYYLYNITEESYLKELAEIIIEQSYNWGKIFNDFPYLETTHKYMSRNLFVLVKRLSIFWEKINSKRKNRIPKVKTKEQIEKDNNSKNLHIFHETHSVNIAMAFKMPVLEYLLDGNNANLHTARNGISQVMKYHGLTNHVFSGDEHLNGQLPTVGSELCLVAEYMHSLETMLSVTGESEYADILEQVAYNAWPATFLEDMSAHQYVQQVNQIEVSKKKRGWYDGFDESNIFGLEPNYGCCAANMHQGWPKLAGSILMKGKGGITAGIYAPCTVELEIADSGVRLREVTEYPFDGAIELNIEKIDNSKKELNFPLWLRIPTWCRNYTLLINGEQTKCDAIKGFVQISRTFKEGDSIRLNLSMETRYEKTGRGSISIHYGALLMALPIDGEKRKLRGEEPFADWEIYPVSNWRYAAIESEIQKGNITKKETDKYPFGDNDCPISIVMNMASAPQWMSKNGDVDSFPELFVVPRAEIEEKRLVPFGSTRLRIAEFPIATIKEE